MPEFRDHPTVAAVPPVDDPGGFGHWRRNLVVCVFGSFAMAVAMTLMLPFLPLYVEQLGVSAPPAVIQWSGIAYGASFFSAALTAPLWGRVADRYGRKLTLVRASLGMTIVMSLMGCAHTVEQLVILRLFAGLLGGYTSGSMVLVATQTPKARCGWALGVLSSGIVAGNVVGPLIGGTLPSMIGIRATFLAAGAVIGVAFVATVSFVKRDYPTAKRGEHATENKGWGAVPDKRPIVAMLLTGMLLLLANMSIEPIISVYVGQLVTTPDHVTLVAGLVMSGAALGSILSASWLGRLADRIGHWRVIVGSLFACAILLVPQAFVTHAWQLIALRFSMGIALGGLLPSIASVIRHSVPPNVTGSMLCYSTSAQYAGQVAGPLVGSYFGSHYGMRSVFWSTALLMSVGVLVNWIVLTRIRHRPTNVRPSGHCRADVLCNGTPARTRVAEANAEG
ncbi:MFS transporter [Burkholderia sp. Bp9031]|uniref:MFS transporter n=1 Tax=Burkholderia sp. Bp9031 TaxID=2184566 RepID=UPI000F5DF0BA|nr:MFS transporter [Burkholderia sp. Bp9031]RQZ17109.1 MFS transporter [Burkholderia sp. Bp9031]